MRLHESLAENKLRFAQRLNEMSDELATLAKEVEKNRKHVRPFMSGRISAHLNLDEGACNSV